MSMFNIYLYIQYNYIDVDNNSNNNDDPFERLSARIQLDNANRIASMHFTFSVRIQFGEREGVGMAI